MSLPSLASVTDLERRIGAPVDDETQAQAFLDDASGLIRLEVDPVTWVDDEGSLEAVPAVVVTVCCKAARRAMEDREGVMQRSETLGSYTNAEMFHGTHATDVYLTQAERRLVRRAAGRSAIGSVLVSNQEDRARSPYLDVEGQTGEPFLMGTDGW